MEKQICKITGMTISTNKNMNRKFTMEDAYELLAHGFEPQWNKDENFDMGGPALGGIDMFGVQGESFYFAKDGELFAIFNNEEGTQIEFV